jgi:hypothetical protein
MFLCRHSIRDDLKLVEHLYFLIVPNNSSCTFMTIKVRSPKLVKGVLSMFYVYFMDQLQVITS